jgi:aquaglyceroporin related protein, other eukaryote
MVAPFFGCTFGGWLYDALLFTGESPVNTPFLGLKRLVRPSAATAAPGTTTRDGYNEKV